MRPMDCCAFEMGARMGCVRNSEVDQLLLFAERSRSCLGTTDARCRDALRHRMRRGEVVKPAPGVYARSAYWSGLPERERALHVMRAQQKLHPDWVFCGFSAALAHGLPVAYREIGQSHLASSSECRHSSRKGMRWHVVDGVRPVTMQGIRVTSFERTVLDCMRSSDFGMALAIADAALRRARISSARLMGYFKSNGKGLAGIRHAMKALLYADARSESPGESIARAAMIRDGFTLPDLQVALPSMIDPSRSYRVDFMWMREDGTRVIGEFDGRVKYSDSSILRGATSLDALIAERRRESELSMHGMPIVRFGWREATHPAELRKLLVAYGVPRSELFAREVGAVLRSRTVSAKTFSVMPL